MASTSRRRKSSLRQKAKGLSGDSISTPQMEALEQRQLLSAAAVVRHAHQALSQSRSVATASHKVAATRHSGSHKGHRATPADDSDPVFIETSIMPGQTKWTSADTYSFSNQHIGTMSWSLSDTSSGQISAQFYDDAGDQTLPDALGNYTGSTFPLTEAAGTHSWGIVLVDPSGSYGADAMIQFLW